MIFPQGLSQSLFDIQKSKGPRKASLSSYVEVEKNGKMTGTDNQTSFHAGANRPQLHSLMVINKPLVLLSLHP